MSTLVLTRNDVKGLLEMSSVIEAVEQAFKDWHQGQAQMPPKAYLVLEKGDFRAMPAALRGGVGIKWVNVHTQNPSQGLPTVMAILIYNDRDTGYPLAIMDATEITTYRTGATAAIAAKHLARPDSKTLGLIGAGSQARTQLLAHVQLFNFSQIRVFDINKTAIERFIKLLPQYPIRGATLQEAAASDIVCTVTPAREPILKKEWLRPGTHVNAIGADARGKEELEPSILNDAVVVVDDLRQASGGGEINVPLSKGLFRIDQVYGTLDEIIAGVKQGRRNQNAITIFDSTGVAIEDMATAKLIYEKAKQKGGYLSLNMVD